MKLSRRNGCIYRHETNESAAIRLKMNVRTYVKYKNICLNLGLLKNYKGTLQAVSLKDCNATLEINTRHANFFKNFAYTKLSFMIVYRQIQKSLLERNFEQQEFAISRRFDFLTNDCYNATKKAARLAAKAGVSYDDFLKSALAERKYVATGKYHAGEILNMSSSTGRRVLLSLKDRYSLTTIYRTSGLPATPETFNHVKGLYGGYVVNKAGKWVAILGTKVTKVANNSPVLQAA